MLKLAKLADLRRIPVGTKLYLTNHIRASKSRHTTIYNQTSDVPTVDLDGFESHLNPGPKRMKAGQVSIDAEKLRVSISDVKGRLYVTLDFHPDIVSTYPPNAPL